MSNEIAILLPLRLETLFEEKGDGWHMLLRIIPDEASICRDNPSVSVDEGLCLQEMWQRVYTAQPDPNAAPDTWLNVDRADFTDEQRATIKQAWQTLCSQMQPARASYLATQYLPQQIVDEQAQLALPAPADPRHNYVGGLPKEIAIYARFNNQPPLKLATTMPIQHDQLVFDIIGGGEVSENVTEVAKDRWWVSWELAQDVGLGVEVPLPNDLTPADITNLFAIGLGEENPAAHFRAQIEAGEMATMGLGTPTNTVDGKPAADLAAQGDTWLKITNARLRKENSLLSHVLTGDPTALPAHPTAQRGTHSYGTLLVNTLWPVLWGQHLKDMWGLGEAVHQLGLWATGADRGDDGNLHPEGPLPPIRIDDQPYGLLPTTSLLRWKAAAMPDAFDALETQMIPALTQLRSVWAAVARSKGNTVGADTSRLLALIGQPAATQQFEYMRVMPLVLVQAVAENSIFGSGEEVLRAAQKLYDPSEQLLGKRISDDPDLRYYVMSGVLRSMDLPLIQPTIWPEWYYKTLNDVVLLDSNGKPIPELTPEEGLIRLLERLAMIGPNLPPILYYLEEPLFRTMPDSLLIRLLIEATFLSMAYMVQEPDARPLLDPVARKDTLAAVEDMATGYHVELDHNNSAGMLRVMQAKYTDALVEPFARDAKALERSFRATLDTAMHRIDPWITGISWRRLKNVAAAPDTQYKLGVYGWVDGPMLGKPGPTAGGLLHAPSHAQALTSVILRDKFITEQANGTVPNHWDMQLESRVIRRAEELAEEVALGSHHYEVLGRQVERVIGTRAGVAELRRTFPMHSADRTGAVCDGEAALKQLLLSEALGATPLLATQLTELRLLRDVVNTYGDLLVAEAVHHVVQGRAEVAGAAMDAAAGLAAPPTLEFTKTPLRANALQTSVAIAAPYFDYAGAVDASASPAWLADTSVASLLEARFGAGNAWQWAFTFEEITVTVSLNDVTLTPADTLVLSAQTLELLMRNMLRVQLSGVLIADPGRYAIAMLALLTADLSNALGAQWHRNAREFVRLIAGQPALSQDLLHHTSDAPTRQMSAVADVAVHTELQTRYSRVRFAADDLLAEIDLMLLPENLAINDVAMRQQTLYRALRWGIMPAIDDHEQTQYFSYLIDGSIDETALIADFLQRVRDALADRLEAAPIPAPIRAQELARAIADLVAPEGQLAIMSQIPANTIAAVSQLDPTPDGTLEDDWLTMVAAVRQPLARLEALQLEAQMKGDGNQALTAYSNAPADHWLKAQLNTGITPRFIAVYGAGINAWQAGSTLAVTLLDSWSEAVARPDQNTTAAFGFNAPGARAPQAILLAVPPVLDQPLDEATLIDILIETRDLAHARTARLEDLTDYLALVPGTMFRNTGLTRVQLGPEETAVIR